MPNAIIRWVSPLDFNDILEIEQLSSEIPLKKEDLELYTGHEDVSQFLISFRNDILGYLLYQKNDLAIGVIRLCVHPSCRRRGLGTLLINKLKEVLYFGTQNKIIFGVYDTNLDGQLFLQKQGCIATKIAPNNERLYVFEYNAPLELLMKRNHYVFVSLDNSWTNHKWVIPDNLILLHEEEIRKAKNIGRYLELLAKGDI